MGLKHCHTIARLKECRVQLNALIETGRKLGFDGSTEFQTSENALKAIDQKLQAIFRARRSIS
jgi:hypothetical protein